MKGKEFERFENDPLYRFFTIKIEEVGREIKDKSDKIKKLTEEQTALKRGKTEMVKLRRQFNCITGYNK
jgi:hypothetical protein